MLSKVLLWINDNLSNVLYGISLITRVNNGGIETYYSVVLAIVWVSGVHRYLPVIVAVGVTLLDETQKSPPPLSTNIAFVLPIRQELFRENREIQNGFFAMVSIDGHALDTAVDKSPW